MRRHTLQQYHGMLGAQNQRALQQPHRTNRQQHKSGKRFGAVYNADGCRSCRHSSAAKLARHLALDAECCPLLLCSKRGFERALQQRRCPLSMRRLHLTWSAPLEIAACPSSACVLFLDDLTALLQQISSHLSALFDRASFDWTNQRVAMKRSADYFSQSHVERTIHDESVEQHGKLL